LDEFVPKQYSQLLYVDGDTQVLESLDELISAHVGPGQFLAATDPIAFKYNEMSDAPKELREYFARLGLKSIKQYFNSGVLRINRQGWADIGARAYDFRLRAKKGDLHFWDQDGLNAVAASPEVRLPMSIRFNFPIFLRNCRVEAQLVPAIYHFMSNPKPWNGNFPPWSQWATLPYSSISQKYPKLSRYQAPFSSWKKARYALQQRVKQVDESLTWGLTWRRSEVLSYERDCQQFNLGPNQPVATGGPFVSADTVKVSIIVNNYNYAPYLAAAINSALAQSYQPLEVIVVDDGSTDGSREILESFADRVTLVLRENGGQAAAFNSGFAKSSGQLVAFLDSDDVLMPDAIQRAAAHWDDKFSKLQFPLEILDIKGNPTGLRMPRQPVSSGNLTEAVLKSGRYVSSPTSGNLFSRRFLEQVFPIPEAEWAKTADGYLNNCAPFFGPIGAIQEPLAYYRVHGQSMSSVIGSNGRLNVGTAEQLLKNGLQEKALIEKCALERGLQADPGIVVSHWMFLKLKLTLAKTALQSKRMAYLSKEVLTSGFRMVLSALRSPDLRPVKRVQHAAWALCVMFLPSQLAQRAIRFAFEPAPTPGVVQALRR
jgi:hypothetical protein